MQPQPLIAVSDVEASSRWYQQLLDAQSGHGGDEYEQLLRNGVMIMQLHAWEVDEHPNLVDASISPRGYGVLLWFATDDFDAAVTRVRALAAEVIQEPHINPNAHHREIWLRDPDGYAIVIAGA